jgi:DNA-binding transcriptional LysR family regulator
MNHMNRLQAMELFVSAVKEGSFSAAGRRAGLSPASVSRYIADLEADLGAQLLNRTSRSLSLTEVGQAYALRVETILQNIREADAAVSALHTTPRGTLRVHSRTLFGMTVVAPLIPAFQKLCPELKVELHLSEHADAFREGEFDIELRIGAPQDSSLMQKKLFATERILVASPGYVAEQSKVQAPEDLMLHNCLTYWLGPEEVVWRFLREGQLEEVRVRSTFCSNNGQVLRQLAMAGHGIVLLDSYTVLRDIAEGTLVRILSEYQVTNGNFENGIYAAFRPMPYLPAKIKAFLDFITERVPPFMRTGDMVAFETREH